MAGIPLVVTGALPATTTGAGPGGPEADRASGGAPEREQAESVIAAAMPAAQRYRPRLRRAATVISCAWFGFDANTVSGWEDRPVVAGDDYRMLWRATGRPASSAVSSKGQ